MFRSKESKLLPATKCIIQKLETYDKYSLLLCGDIESNPGPVINTSMSVLTARLARIGLQPVNIAGDGNCFFRSVSYQLYQTEDCHAQIRALAIQHLINCPEHFIESNTQQSWVQYLQDMSMLGTWADHIIIQAVANANSLRIHITESAPNFCESTVVSSVYVESGENVRDIYIGHLDELHYVSTTPTAQSVSRQVENEKANKLQPKPNSQNLQTKSRKSYMREYMMKRRKDENFKKKENERKKTYNKNYRKANPEKVKELLKKAAVTYRQSNPDKEKQTKIKYRESNPEKTKDSFKKATATYTQSNPDKVKQTKITYRKSNPKKIKDSSKKSTVTYRQSNIEKSRESSKMSSRIYNQNYPERLKNIQKRNYIKRKFAQNENEAEMNEQKRLKLNLNSQITCETSSQSENNSTEARSPMTIAQATETFHKNISVGPEHICTCCDQLWYRSSVTECNPSLYKSCSNEILNLCLTGVKSIDNTEWICGTCHSNLKDGKLPSCAKANKMTFPEKPDVLNDLTSLEERLISPRIPFMQVRELPSGGQLSIHGNVVNVPADVNTTVSVLPRPINESRTIPIKLKRRLGYKHHYQFQNVRPSKVLEAARYLVCNSEIFKNEGIEVMDNYETNPLNNVNEEAWSEFIANNTEETSDIVSNEVNIQSQENVATMQASNDPIDNDTDDEWCEPTERASGVMDTLLQEPDITQDGDKIISFAPGEGNRPLGIFIDKDSEFLSFPTIYCGKRQADNSERLVPVHYSTICKWELRSQDRKVAQSVPNIFLQIKKITD
ncbi:Hypothetical predicted protein [Paramuricea clavata]|uniref:Uncharacterized protein n=2 Tax=Paramuricea clavata TaxID=317549 RepID=A0A7D9HLP0_PARCT|nr:Hypothetical predicted protein [Paramuricea clavata]